MIYKLCVVTKIMGQLRGKSTYDQAISYMPRHFSVRDTQLEGEISEVL